MILPSTGTEVTQSETLANPLAHTMADPRVYLLVFGVVQLIGAASYSSYGLLDNVGYSPTLPLQ